MKKIAFLAALASAVPLAAPLAHADGYDSRHIAAGERDARARSYVTLTAMDVQRDKTVDIDPALGRFRRLHVQAIRGAGYIDFIEVRYANGQQEHVDVKRRIGRGESADIDLNGSHRIAAITVHGDNDGRSQIEIVGER